MIFDCDPRRTRMLVMTSLTMAVICWNNDLLFYAFCIMSLMVAVGATNIW